MVRIRCPASLVLYQPRARSLHQVVRLVPIILLEERLSLFPVIILETMMDQRLQKQVLGTCSSRSWRTQVLQTL